MTPEESVKDLESKAIRAQGMEAICMDVHCILGKSDTHVADKLKKASMARREAEAALATKRRKIGADVGDGEMTDPPKPAPPKSVPPKSTPPKSVPYVPDDPKPRRAVGVCVLVRVCAVGVHVCACVCVCSASITPSFHKRHLKKTQASMRA